LSNDIKSNLESFKRQGEGILIRFERAIQNQQNPLTDISQDLISEGARLVVRDFIPSLGRATRKYTKHYLRQQQKRQRRALEERIENEVHSWFTSLKTFIETISIETKNIYQPDSQKLVIKLNKQLAYAKIDTKIKHIINFINQLLDRKLIYNKEIPSKPSKKKFESLIEPSTPFSGQQKVREILSDAQGYVKVLDPYVDDYTLDLLLNVPMNISIMLLTENIGGHRRAKSFTRSCRRFKAERPQFHIRKCKKGLLHDRYVITRNKAYSIGSSLKDLGKKLSSIIEIVETKEKIEKQFDKIWATSTNLVC